MRSGSLFSGSGMLDVAVHRVLNAEPAWFAETDRAASAVLAHHWPDAPNLGDVATAVWSAADPIDVLTGGFPCQDVSSAGLRRGLRSGTRSGLWAHMARAIAALRPSLVVIENVRGLLSADADCELESCAWCVGDDEGRPLRALGCVLGDLADLGYDARWCGLRASDVGACHERFRIFILAYPADSDSLGQIRAGASRRRWSGSPDHRPTAPDPHGEGWQGTQPTSRLVMPARGVGSNAPCDGRNTRWTESARQRGGSDAPVGGHVAVADPTSVGVPDGSFNGGEVIHEPEPRTGCGDRSRDSAEGVHDFGRPAAELAWGPYESAIRRWELILGRNAPAPTQPGRRGGAQLSAAFAEWLMGWPQGWVTAVPGLSRNDQLKICGGGVVPQQAEPALRWLLSVNPGEKVSA